MWYQSGAWFVSSVTLPGIMHYLHRLAVDEKTGAMMTVTGILTSGLLQEAGTDRGISLCHLHRPPCPLHRLTFPGMTRIVYSIASTTPPPVLPGERPTLM